MSRISWIVAVVAGLGLPAVVSAQEYAGLPEPLPGSIVDGTILGAPPAGEIVGAPAAGGVVGTPATPGRPIHAYSYYYEFPAPARTYVPYNASDSFTFLGQAYGHAYDRWTWPAMSNASPGLGRYYQLLH